ncbi:hypothetical protein SBOR_8818 [Sclerotinia borealis F-4128]|uniref:Tesmin/TSO1-like CXC domain-containing protein n=1 Tax=Sclerotinia borealis (strain F-4128) TaxID=1432307 RepID=W9C7F1_SCLBF|nr:hypothetical protein SBOR_8818 [Sclerotinia borealis F-4128]
MGLNRPEPSSMHEKDAHPAKRRKYPLSTPGPSQEKIQDLLMDFKPSQLRQVIDVALKRGDVTRCIRHIHARFPEKSPNNDHLEPLAEGWIPVKDEVVESIEKSTKPVRQYAPVPVSLKTRQPPLQPLPVEHKESLPENTIRPFVHLPKVTNGNLPTPRNSQEPFLKEIPMTPEPYLTPEPMLDTRPPPPLNPEINIHPSPQAITCNCRSGCSSTRCKCYKSGRGCSPSPSSGCKCESCVNMLNDLSSFFGTLKSSPNSSTIANITASSDLLKWIRKESRNGRFDLIHRDTIEELRSMLMGVEYGYIWSAPTFAVFSSGRLGGIERAWMRADITDEERQYVKKELFKEAFGVVGGKETEPKKNYWCFCTNQWKQTMLWEYCTKCDECRDIREWHCKGCGKRTNEESCDCKKVLNVENGVQAHGKLGPKDQLADSGGLSRPSSALG